MSAVSEPIRCACYQGRGDGIDLPISELRYATRGAKRTPATRLGALLARLAINYVSDPGYLSGPILMRDLRAGTEAIPDLVNAEMSIGTWRISGFSLS